MGLSTTKDVKIWGRQYLAGRVQFFEINAKSVIFLDADLRPEEVKGIEIVGSKSAAGELACKVVARDGHFSVEPESPNRFSARVIHDQVLE